MTSSLEALIERKFSEHEAREEERFRAIVEDFERDAFPDGAAAHRLAHQAMIDAAKQEAEFWRELKIEIARKSIWGILQVLVVLLLAGVAAKFGLAGLAALGGGVVPK